MPGSGFEDGARQFGALAVVLKQVGQDGLRRELYKAISDAAGPVAKKIKSTAHLNPYLPDHYAAVLSADLRVQTFKQTGRDPGVIIHIDAPTFGRGGRKIRDLNDGRLSHPLFGDRGRWFRQPVEPGVVTDPCEESAPRVRAEILAALDRVRAKAEASV